MVYRVAEMNQEVEGYLQKSSNTLHQWHKLSYYKIFLGAEKTEFVKVNSDGKTTVKHTFSKNNSDILVVPVSKNPKSNNFLAFHILNAKTKRRIATYRANNIADMRKFMRALGGVTSSSTDLLLCDGQSLRDAPDSISVSTLMLASRDPQQDRLVRFKSYESLFTLDDEATSKIILDKPPTYHDVVNQLPLEYYLPEGMSLPEPIIQHASSEVLETGETDGIDKESRRPWNDTFLPPHGPPVVCPVSIGYGLEIGYKSGYQALWDPVSQKVYYVDHVEKKTITEIRCSSPFQSQLEEAPSGDASNADNESSKDCKIKLTRMQIVGWDIDGTFKPNECIEIFNINILNAGETSLPAGTKLSIPSNPLVRFECGSVLLPALKGGESYDVREKIHGRIFDNPSPNEPGPFTSEVDFSPVLNLPNGSKKKLFTMQQKIQVEYPIKLKEFKSPSTLLPGELGIFEVTLQNVSNCAYGSDGKGAVEVGIYLDCRLLPTTKVSDTNGVPYVISFDPSKRDSFKIEVKKINPKESLTIQLAMKMEKEAEVFDQCLWQASVFFRKKLIEYGFSTVRVAPLNNTYDPNSDVVMVTKEMTETEYIFWQHLFKSLSLSVCTWNPKEGNLVNTIKMSTITQSSSKLILYESTDVEHLPSKELIKYLQDGEPSTNINIVVMVPSSCDLSAKQAITQKVLELTGLENLPAEVRKSKRKSKSLINASLPDKSPSMTSINTLTSEKSIQLSSSGVSVYVISLSAGCKLILIDGVDTSTNISSLFSSDVPLESNYGQSFLALLQSLPFARKLQLYENDEALGRFEMPNTLYIGSADIVMLCIAYDICDKAIKLNAEPKVLQELLSQVKEEDQPKAYRLSKAVKYQALEMSVDKPPKVRKLLEQMMHTCQHASKQLKGKRKEIEKFKMPTLRQILNLYSSQE